MNKYEKYINSFYMLLTECNVKEEIYIYSLCMLLTNIKKKEKIFIIFIYKYILKGVMKCINSSSNNFILLIMFSAHANKQV